jgi:hypothetical protein
MGAGGMLAGEEETLRRKLSAGARPASELPAPRTAGAAHLSVGRHRPPLGNRRRWGIIWRATVHLRCERWGRWRSCEAGGESGSAPTSQRRGASTDGCELKKQERE